MKAFPTHREEGMELRDYFAAKAMQGYLSLPQIAEALSLNTIDEDGVAGACYEWADAMMEARNGSL